MEKSPTTTNAAKEKETVQKYKTREEIEKLLTTDLVFSCDPNKEVRELVALLNEHFDADKGKRVEMDAKVNQKATEVALTLGVQTHAPLAESVDTRYRPLVIEFANQLIKEFQCISHSERALAQVAAGSYVKFMTFSKKLDHVTSLESTNSEKNGYYGMIGREVDRAERRFLSAVMALKQIKSPTMNLQFKVGTAFVAQNQQINADSNSNPDSHEIIDAK